MRFRIAPPRSWARLAVTELIPAGRAATGLVPTRLRATRLGTADLVERSRYAGVARFAFHLFAVAVATLTAANDTVASEGEVASEGVVAGTEQPLSFNRDIRPILSDACIFCHGPDSAHREAGLRLDVEDEAKAYAIVPGDAEGSELIARVTAEDEFLQMPPPESGKELTAAQIETLRRWVDQGAPYEPHWAYVPPEKHPAPQVEDAEWAEDPIDRFVYDAIREEGMEPSEEADLRTLVRRVTFDLTGLPPDPERVDAVLADPGPDAYARYVDELLLSPAYGERMAMYWLDLVRYADTVGYHGDQDHSISPYRDYVIDAFNRNLPLDRFTREQLAGDLLPDATTDTRVASGYNRLLQTSHEGGVQPKEYLAIYAADRVRNLSEVWMGATVGCAQCHDHKYDPYTIDDFYSMVAFFGDVDESKHFSVGSNALPTKRPPEIEVLPRWKRELARRLESELKSSPEGDRHEELQKRLKRLRESARLTMVTESIEPREIRVLPRGNWMDDSGPVVEPETPAFLPPIEVSETDVSGEESGEEAGSRRRTRLDLANWLTDPDDGVGGLTARVFVNRFWYLTFGRGLSSSLTDFGGQGEPPTHPELLDRLSIDFIESGWDVKRMLRRLVLSRAYRQSSVATPAERKADPENRWFARQSRYRLPAESVRDQALATGGLLVRRVGGASVKPYQPIGYYRHLNFPTRSYMPHLDERQYRRGVYIHWQRQFLHPMLKALDAPSREECTARRPRSNTPLEALVMLNDPSMVEAAVGLVVRVAVEFDLANRDDVTLIAEDATDAEVANGVGVTNVDGGGDAEVAGGDDTITAPLERMFRLATSRAPDETERSALVRLLANEREHYRRNPERAEMLLDEFRDTAAMAGERDPGELAAWVATARAILNLHETVTRE